MLEAKTIIDQVQQGYYPPAWHIYRGRGQWGKALLSILVYWVNFYASIGLLLMLIFLILILSSNIDELANKTFTHFLSLSIFFLLVTGMISIPIVILRKAYTAAQTLLVILPDRVLLYSKSKQTKTAAIAFADILQIHLEKNVAKSYSGRYKAFSHTTTSYWLDLYTHEGHYLKWPLNNSLEEPDTIGKDIIATHQHYQHQI